MALDVEAVANGEVAGEELNRAWSLEANPCPFPPSHRLARILSSSPAPLVAPLQPDGGERRAISSQSTSHDCPGHEALSFSSFRISFSAAVSSRLSWTKMSSTSPSASTARHTHIRRPPIETNILSRCQRSSARSRRRRSRPALSWANFASQRRTLPAGSCDSAIQTAPGPGPSDTLRQPRPPSGRIWKSGPP